MIPLVKPILGAEEKRIVSEIIDSSIIASGKYVHEFENTCAAKWGTKYGIAVSSGTTALHAALLASGVKPGDKVLTTPFSFIATANSILFCGARPVFADIDPLDYNLSPDAVESILKKQKIKAILLVHLYGTPANMDAFMELKKKYKVILIEDCAQSQGAMFNNKIVGSFGESSAFSFYATKNITTGEGGVVLTNSAKIDKLTRQIINHGRKNQSTHSILGYNFRMTNIAAGIGIVQLKRLDEWNNIRLKNALFFNENLKNVDFITAPFIRPETRPVFHQYTIRINAKLRQRFIQHLTDNGIGCGIYYPYVIYKQDFYKKLGYVSGLCPQAEKATREVVSIPVHPSLTKQELEKIVEVIRGFK